MTHSSALRGALRTAGLVGSIRLTRNLVVVVLAEPCSAKSSRMVCEVSGLISACTKKANSSGRSAFSIGMNRHSPKAHFRRSVWASPA